MYMFEFGTSAGLGVAALMLFLLAWAWAVRSRRAARRKTPAAADEPAAAARKGRSDPRIAAIETLQADLAARMDALVSAQNEPEERLQALASQILGLIRDKNATLETALAGLDQLRARMRTLEQVGDLAETRELLSEMSGRLDDQKSAQSADMAVLERRIGQLETPGENPFAEISEQLTRLYTQKDDAIDAVLNRIGPLERRLAEIEGHAPARASALDQIRASVETLQKAQEAHGDTLSVLSSGVIDTKALADGISALRNQKAEIAKGLATRLDTIEQKLAERDPGPMVARLTERLNAFREMMAASETALKDRLAALETPGESPFAEISEQLTRLYAQKDATVETVFARLAPLEAKLAEIGAGTGGADAQGALARITERLEALKERIAPLEARFETFAGQFATRDLLDRFSERLDALREMQAAGETALRDRVALLEAPGESPFAEISAQLTGLYAQKDAAVETVFARLVPLEARLDELEEILSASDPRNGLLELREWIGEVDGRHVASEALVRSQVERLAEAQSAARSDFAALRAETVSVDIIAQRLEGLHAQKDALSEALMSRMRQIEEDMASQDPRALLDGFSDRFEALRERVTLLENPGESPFSEISEQLTRLYAQKDATVETVFARLAPLEAKLSDLETGLGNTVQQDQIGELASRLDALDWGQDELAERIGGMDALAARVAGREVSARIAPLEALLSDLESGIGNAAPREQAEALASRLDALEDDLAAQDPRSALDRFAERLEALKERVVLLETPGESPFSEISEQLTRLYAQKDATVETVFARLAPLEAKLSDLETGLGNAVPREQAEGLAASVAAKEVSTRLAPIESALGALRKDLAAQDARLALDRFAERFEALKDRVELLETPGESSFSEISEQLARLHAEKDAAAETVFARLAPLEAKLSDLETGLGNAVPRAQVEGLASRLDALDWSQDELADRLAGIRAAAEDKAAKVAASQVGPLQVRLAEMEGMLAAQDPQAALDRFSERLDSLRDRVSGLENPDGSPLSEISDQLARLHAEKDAAAETVFARLAPLEAKLSDLETGLGNAVPRAQVEGLASRLDALSAAQDGTSERLAAIGSKAAQGISMAEFRKELSQVLASRGAGLDALLKRLAPLEDRLADLEARPWDPDADEARAQAQEVAMQLIAARAAAQHTELFADRLALLEATLPRLSATQSILMQTLDRKDGVSEMAGRIAAALNPPAKAAGKLGKGDDLGEIHSMPRVISLHQK